jgi:adenosylmethionine-8-amino-7-oxononanoate aminotransferase
LATLDIFNDDDVLASNRQRMQWLGHALSKVATHPSVRHPRQRGMIAAFDVAPTVREGFARRCFTAALEQELLLRPIGTTVYWMPPYVLTEEEIAGLGESTLRVLDAVC